MITTNGLQQNLRSFYRLKVWNLIELKQSNTALKHIAFGQVLQNQRFLRQSCFLMQIRWKLLEHVMSFAWLALLAKYMEEQEKNTQ